MKIAPIAVQWVKVNAIFDFVAEGALMFYKHLFFALSIIFSNGSIPHA